MDISTCDESLADSALLLGVILNILLLVKLDVSGITAEMCPKR
jgi:hypothetical protein